MIELCHKLNPHYKKISMLIVSLFEKTRAEGMAKKAYYNIFADTYLLQIIYSLLRETCDAQVSEERIPFVVPDGKYGATAQLVKQYIEAHFAEPLTVSGIADQFGYSESHINKIFREVYQCGIPFYLKTLRVEKSKELISYSEYALKQIASLVGFKNVHHFSRVFKDVVGIPPGQWHDAEKDRIRKDIYFE